MGLKRQQAMTAPFMETGMSLIFLICAQRHEIVKPRSRPQRRAAAPQEEAQDWHAASKIGPVILSGHYDFRQSKG